MNTPSMLVNLGWSVYLIRFWYYAVAMSVGVSADVLPYYLLLLFLFTGVPSLYLWFYDYVIQIAIQLLFKYEFNSYKRLVNNYGEWGYKTGSWGSASQVLPLQKGGGRKRF